MIKTKSIVNYFGYVNQLKKLIEEIIELIEALAKGDREAILEELSDVCFLIEQFSLCIKHQLKEDFNISQEEILNVIDFKKERTIEKYNILVKGSKK